MPEHEPDLESPDLESPDEVAVDEQPPEELEDDFEPELDEVDEVLGGDASTVEAEDAEEEAEEEADEEALDELEAEELELLDEELSESLLVDEAAELRAIRREELAFTVEVQGVAPGEFVCQSCFLVKRRSQLADPVRMICRDCAT